ncbi:DUF460 domain-containing protein [Candidatus Woesearchaeota archaeon]|nr:DUF460 domain-containing protein [Candidatus Woesearchaeota archaeon]
MRELLIVGVDPGTTVGYAALDTHGRVLKTRSSKQLELNSLLEEIVKLGSILAIGTDKGKCPSLIGKAAAKTGAKIIVPKEDLLVAEKDALTKGRMSGNGHERDALAAALYAYKELEPLLNRIEKALEREGKQDIFREVTEIVVATGTNIKDAIRDADGKRKEEAEVLERSLITAATAAAATDASELKEKTSQEKMQEMLLKRMKNENEILRNYNDKLIARIKLAGKELKKAAKAKLRESAATTDLRKQEIETRHRQLLAKMQGIINQKNTKLAGLMHEKELLERILAAEVVVIKKLDTLGYDELRQKNSRLGLKENDTVLVENPESFSQKTLEQLQHKNITVIARNKINSTVAKTLHDYGITAVPAAGIQLIESENFAAADKEQLERAKERHADKNIAGLIESYREERKMQYD